MKVLILATHSDTTNLLINSLKNKFELEIVFEDSVSKLVFWKRRFNKLGIFRTLNQILFLLFIQILKPFFLKNKFSYFESKQFSLTLNNDIKINNVDSINTDKSIKLISSIEADIILINGTRIVSKKLLDSVEKSFINIHCGITPKYRGVHGGYWAAYHRDFENLGVTIHEVDKGVDTGDILFQGNVSYSEDLNYFLYPLKQYSIAIPELISILERLHDDGILRTFHRNDLPSKLWYHPTLTGYLYGLIFKGIK